MTLAGLRLALWVLALGSNSAQGAQPLQVMAVPSLDKHGGRSVELGGYWFIAPAGRLAPAMVLLHGCSGAFDKKSGTLAARYTDMAGRLNALGVHALVIDSLGPRGEKELCTQRLGQRQVTMTQRRRDALGALQWLAAQPQVDKSRIGLLGWSNGGSTVMAATNAQHAEVHAAAVKPSLAVGFYPGCESELKRGYLPIAPVLMLLGEADDWTPAAPCKALAAAVNTAHTPVQYEAYAGAYHGFDGTAPVRLRRDVPNGTRPGAGVHVGADPAARAAAAARLEQFLMDQWRLRP
jgi:dienelactone hydrolase